MKPRKDKDTRDLLERILEVLQKNEPVLKDREEIPLKVMQTIQKSQRQKSPLRLIGSSSVPFLTFAQRMLTAASVCLLILYGIEEFIVVKKVNTLEQQTAAVRVTPVNTLASRLEKSGITFVSLQQRFQARKKLIAAQPHETRYQLDVTIKTSRP
ncbi:MAG: hypothetical protein ABIJ04_06225 [Bacteroidota bacterium]